MARRLRLIGVISTGSSAFTQGFSGQRGVRYVDGGTLLSTAGLTAGVDATLHLLARRHGAELAARVAEALHIPPSPFVENPKCQQFEIGPADSIFLLNAGFRWPEPRVRVS